MKKTNILTAIAAVIALSSATSFAEATASSAIPAGQEQCKVLDSEGRGLIKENRADGTTSNPNPGQNQAGDPEAFILVPEGQCAKINAGDFTGVGPDITDKIEVIENK